MDHEFVSLDISHLTLILKGDLLLVVKNQLNGRMKQNGSSVTVNLAIVIIVQAPDLVFGIS